MNYFGYFGLWRKRSIDDKFDTPRIENSAEVPNQRTRLERRPIGHGSRNTGAKESYKK